MAAAGRQLIVVAVVTLTALVHRSWALSCIPCRYQDECGPTPNCTYGFQRMPCGCCSVCANGPRERCGGNWGRLGRCGTGLACMLLYGETGVCIYQHHVNNKFWLGGTDLNNKGQWEWTNGHPIELHQYPFRRQNPWDLHQPNDDKLENCLAWNRYRFSDEGCHQQMKYICELESNDGPTTNEPTVTTTIPYNCENHKGKYLYYPNWAWNLCGVSTNNCTDLKDEHYCRDWDCQPGYGKYRCSSGHCISLNKLCDGEPDCPNEEDEQECPIVDCSNNGGIQVGRRCLIISEDELSWQEASTACIGKGGNLASFHDLLDLQILQDYLLSLNDNTTATDVSETTTTSSLANVTGSEIDSSPSSYITDPTSPASMGTTLLELVTGTSSTSPEDDSDTEATERNGIPGIKLF